MLLNTYVTCRFPAYSRFSIESPLASLIILANPFQRCDNLSLYRASNLKNNTLFYMESYKSSTQHKGTVGTLNKNWMPDETLNTPLYLAIIDGMCEENLKIRLEWELQPLPSFPFLFAFRNLVITHENVWKSLTRSKRRNRRDFLITPLICHQLKNLSQSARRFRRLLKPFRDPQRGEPPSRNSKMECDHFRNGPETHRPISPWITLIPLLKDQKDVRRFSIRRHLPAQNAILRAEIDPNTSSNPMITPAGIPTISSHWFPLLLESLLVWGHPRCTRSWPWYAGMSSDSLVTRK